MRSCGSILARKKRGGEERDEEKYEKVASFGEAFGETVEQFQLQERRLMGYARRGPCPLFRAVQAARPLRFWTNRYHCTDKREEHRFEVSEVFNPTLFSVFGNICLLLCSPPSVVDHS